MLEQRLISKADILVLDPGAYGGENRGRLKLSGSLPDRNVTLSAPLAKLLRLWFLLQMNQIRPDTRAVIKSASNYTAELSSCFSGKSRFTIVANLFE